MIMRFWSRIFSYILQCGKDERNSKTKFCNKVRYKVNIRVPKGTIVNNPWKFLTGFNHYHYIMHMIVWKIKENFKREDGAYVNVSIFFSPVEWKRFEPLSSPVRCGVGGLATWRWTRSRDFDHIAPRKVLFLGIWGENIVKNGGGAIMHANYTL